MWDSAQVQGYISEWPAADWRYSVAHSLRQTLYPTAGPHCSTFTEGTHGPHCCHIQRAPMALIAAAISRGHPWPSLRQYPEGTHGPHCGNVRRAPMALIAAISRGHSPALIAVLSGEHSLALVAVISGGHSLALIAAVSGGHSPALIAAISGGHFLSVFLSACSRPLTSYPILLR